MDRISRRTFLSTTGAAATGALAASDAALASRAPALTLTCANYVRYLPIATGHSASAAVPRLSGVAVLSVATSAD